MLTAIGENLPHLELVRLLDAEWSPRALFQAPPGDPALAQQVKCIPQFIMAVVNAQKITAKIMVSKRVHLARRNRGQTCFKRIQGHAHPITESNVQAREETDTGPSGMTLVR